LLAHDHTFVFEARETLIRKFVMAADVLRDLSGANGRVFSDRSDEFLIGVFALVAATFSVARPVVCHDRQILSDVAYQYRSSAEGI
jgi:hypothetical protein